MTIMMIAALAGLSGFLGIRLSGLINENSVLRARVASLKRQLQQR
jgi:hypothetical protein